MSAQSKILIFGVGSVLLPATAFIIGGLLESAIPGCNCNEGTGCHGCAGLESIIAFLGFGGIIAAVIALITILPISIILAVILSVFAKPNK